MADIIVISCLIIVFCLFVKYVWSGIKEIMVNRNEMKRIADIPKDLANGKCDK